MGEDKAPQPVGDLDKVLSQFPVSEVLNALVRVLENGGDSKSVAAGRIFGAAKRIFENSK